MIDARTEGEQKQLLDDRKAALDWERKNLIDWTRAAAAELAANPPSRDLRADTRDAFAANVRELREFVTALPADAPSPFLEALLQSSRNVLELVARSLQCADVQQLRAFFQSTYGRQFEHVMMAQMQETTVVEEMYAGIVGHIVDAWLQSVYLAVPAGSKPRDSTRKATDLLKRDIELLDNAQAFANRRNFAVISQGRETDWNQQFQELFERPVR